MGERCLRMAEVTSSSLVGSTSKTVAFAGKMLQQGVRPREILALCTPVIHQRGETCLTCLLALCFCDSCYPSCAMLDKRRFKDKLAELLCWSRTSVEIDAGDEKSNT